MLYGCEVKKFLVKAFVIAGVAFSAAGTAHAGPRQNQPAAAQPAAQSSPSHVAAPWYERFTFGSEIDPGVNSWTPRGEPKASIRVSPRSRWGVTFGLQEQSQRPNDQRNGQASAGAFYDVSPKIRVGTQVVVPQGAYGASEQERNNPRSKPSVKIESAFRF